MEFRTVQSLLIEFGAARRIGEILRQRYAEKRLCLITDAFLHGSGLLAPALSSLADAGWTVTVIDDVVADPPENVVLEVAERARQSRAEIVLGLGGGSSLDVAKLIAALVASSQSLHDMYGIGNVSGPRLPLILIPTTAGTGSEVTPVSIVTTGETTKMGVVSPMLYADMAILDAELTMSLPPAATAMTGIDAMVHAIEAYTSRHLKNPLSDMLACKALGLLNENLLSACGGEANRAAREAMLLGATLAGQAFANAPVAAVHALAYPIGGTFHVPHGLSNSLILPPVLHFNAQVVPHLYAELAEIIVPRPSGSDEAKALAFIQRLESLIEETGIPRRLADVGIRDDDLDGLAADAMKQVRLLGNNPRELTEQDARTIYAAAL
ncbi:iron-containing alcohol dehydrogenase [Alcaligenaceae bacterium CGII-47]|nr:iron-containing alcohol dehydrogenase [Alcaligenaceae bacterium CGII-47]